jgi:hypothetical protein
VVEIHHSKTLEDRKITSTNVFLTCFSNDCTTTASAGIKPRALCKTQKATEFAQNSLTDKNSSDAGCQFPTNLLRDGNSGNTQNEHFSKDSEILSERCRMLDMYEENLFGDALDIKCAEEH